MLKNQMVYIYIHSIYSAYRRKPPAAESGGHQPNLARHCAGFEDQTFGKQKKLEKTKKTFFQRFLRDGRVQPKVSKYLFLLTPLLAAP